MSDLQKIQNQIKDKLLLGINEGMVRFPISDPNFNPLCTQIQEKESPFLNISKCTACSLSDKRKRVLIETKMISKSFFVFASENINFAVIKSCAFTFCFVTISSPQILKKLEFEYYYYKNLTFFKNDSIEE